MFYPKISCLFRRQGHSMADYQKEKIKKLNGGKLPLLNEYSQKEYEYVDTWHVEEKIEGTNIFLELSEYRPGKYQVFVRGKTKDSIIPPHLKEYLQDEFTVERLIKAIPHLNTTMLNLHGLRSKVAFYGEGYGYKIQGDYYKIGEPRFALFDIHAGNLWATRDRIEAASIAMQCESTPVIHKAMLLQEIIDLVKSKRPSLINPGVPMEGVIARGEAYQEFEDGRVEFCGSRKFKLRCEDY